MYCLHLYYIFNYIQINDVRQKTSACQAVRIDFLYTRQRGEKMFAWSTLQFKKLMRIPFSVASGRGRANKSRREAAIESSVCDKDRTRQR